MRVIDQEYGSNSKPISVTCEDDGGVYEFEIVRHGWWEFLIDGYYCSECDCKLRKMKRKPKYCEHCGAKMDGKEGDHGRKRKISR